MKTTEKVWEATKVQFLLRNSQSGIYYARLFHSGKGHFKSLKTDVYSVAKARLPAEVDKVRQIQADHQASQGKLSITTVGDAITLHLDASAKRVDIKDSTKHYWQQITDTLQASWPELAAKKLNAVTEDDCRTWASRFAGLVSSTRYNNTVDCLRAVFELAIANRVIFSNPAKEVGKVKVKQKKLQLPTPDQFSALVKAIREAGAWCSKQCGDLVEFLAFSGCRVDEASWVTWADVNEAAGFIWIHGNPTDSTKNSESRQIPIITAMARLLEDLRKNPRLVRDPKRIGKNYVLAITECQKALDRWCPKLNITRITHHDLRHLFATACIESGVDIPTVSRWLGHKDGGVLAMKTYGHLRNEHSVAMAAKVTFGKV